MKYYARFLWMAVITGILCITIYVVQSENIELSRIILFGTFIQADYYPQYITVITYWFVPLLLFQIIYGTYIYRHFCSASIYYFSRFCNRTKWFLKEAVVLYAFCILYLIVFITTEIIVAVIFTRVTFHIIDLVLIGYYILIYSLFLMITTLAINILAIIFTSNIGFAVVEAITCFCIACYTMVGEYFIVEENLIEEYLWMLKINPFAHLIFGLHSSKFDNLNKLINEKSVSFDLNITLGLYLAGVIVILVIGCLVVKHHNFIESDMEM